MTRLFIPVKREENETDLQKIRIEPRFGRTNEFAIYDTAMKSLEFLKNTNHHQGGSDSFIDMIKKIKGEGVVVAHIGSHAYDSFYSEGFPVYQAEKNANLKEIINLYEDKQLISFPKPKDGSCCSGESKHVSHLEVM